ncbi:unnamed protein product [Caenorhabditis sp. 36 PRJEB53466]|nr:unnamed protein product [Caenorhabditis sp. 36 PRJEB53466]
MKDPQFIGIILFPVSLFGMCFNWTVVWIIIRDKSLKSPFMLLTFVKSLCDAIYLTVYFFYITPMIILANEFLTVHSHYAGYVLIVFYETSIYTHFVTSMNRFSAVFTPISYKTIFSIKSTRAYTIVAAVFSFALTTFVMPILGCRLEYNPITWVSFYDVTVPVCAWYAIYGDFMKNLILVFVDFLIDIITLVKVQKIRRQFRSGKRADNYTKKETDFLKQTCGQGFCYLIGYTSYLMVPEMNSNKYVAFFMSLLSWCFIAMIDGLFTIVYNCEIRTKIWKRSETSVASTVASVRQ